MGLSVVTSNWLERIQRSAMPVGPPPAGIRYLQTSNSPGNKKPERSYCMIGAFLGGEMIGYMTWGIQGRKVQSVFVKPEYRRRRIAETMLNLARQVDPAITHHLDRTDAGDAWVQSVFPDAPERTHNTTEEDYGETGKGSMIEQRLTSTDPRDVGRIRDLTSMARAADASWRAVVNPDVERTEALGEAVIISTKVGRGRHFEVHINDRLVAQRTLLEQAKEFAETALGPLTWRQESVTPEWAVHYYFGPTTEFTEPLTAWVGTRV